MGFRQAAVLSSVSFFLGVLFICFNVDFRLLYQDLVDEAVDDGLQFYTTFYNAPPAIKAMLHGLMGFGIIGTIFKLHKWDESALFFDGTSLAAYVFAVAIYITVTIPALQTIVAPAEGVEAHAEQVEAVRVLAAGNTIMIVLLVAVLLLQGGQEYAKRLEAKELARIQAEEKNKAASKKDQ